MPTADKLDFNEIVKRGNDRFRKERPMPSELYQCAIFFSRLVMEEIDELQSIRQIIELKKWDKEKKIFNFFNNNLRNLILQLNEDLEKQRFIFPFYSKEIFMSQQEATNFLPLFIKQLIKEEKLPASVINEDRSINEEIIKPAIIPLQTTVLEQDRPEFKDS